MKQLACVIFIVLLAACSDRVAEESADPAAVPGKLHVFTVNYPLAWLVGELAGDTAEVSFPAPADTDPAFWKPAPDVVATYQQADLIVLNGAGYARWLRQASLPASRMLDTAAGFDDQLIYEAQGPVHSHGPEGAHSHGEAAFTVWLDPLLFREQARSVAAKLVALAPDSARDIAQRLAALEATIDGWHNKLLAIGEALGDSPVLYSHPVYQYLQRRYALNGRALHWEPGQTPPESEWRNLEALLQAHPARMMLWEDEPLPEVAARLEEMGIAVVVYRPQGNWPDREDFGRVMAGNLDRLGQAAVRSGGGASRQ